MSASSSNSNGNNVDLFEEGKYLQVTYQGTVVTGVVWSYDKESDLLIMQISLPSNETEVAILNVREITNVAPASVEGVSKTSTTLKKVDIVDVTMARRTEEKKVSSERTKAEGINSAVSPLAQEIYNKLSHLNLSCSWDNQVIVLAASHIRIQPPYTAEDCILTGDASFGGALSRIQRIVGSITVKK